MSTLALELIQKAKKNKAQRLDLGNCDLTELPEELFELTNLKELILSSEWNEVSNNKIEKTKTSNIGSENNISIIPYSICKLENLVKLILAYQPITDISGLSKSKELRYLDLLSGKITNIDALSELYNLKLLGLTNCPITDLIPLKKLEKLEQFWATSTQISDLSPLENLKSLRRLFLNDTKVIDLSPLSSLINLQLLDISVTKVNNLSPISNFSNLTSLYISKTEIYNYDVLKNLRNLQIISLSGYNIKTKEDLSFIINCPKLTYLEILDTPALNNAALFSEKGSANILSTAKIYQKSLESDKTEVIFETKMILVGEGDVGKTSIRKKLITGNNYVAKKNTGNSTEGFEIEVYQPKILINGKLQKAKLNIWDLGGQDVQLPTHQFFMRHSALYLFVFNSRLSEEQNRFDKWFYLIKQLSNDPRNPTAVCPIIGVMNQFDKQTKVLNEEAWLKEYQGQLKCFITVNCSIINDSGIKILENEISKQVVNIDSFGTIEMNEKWITVRKYLLKITSSYKLIPMVEYKKICISNGIIQEEVQDTLLNMLDKLGSLLWYEDSISHLSSAENEKLKSVIFLDHQWTAQAIYQLLMDKKKLVSREATISYDELKKYWNGKYWDSHEYLILMMRRFGFCFETNDKEHFILTPLLSTSRHVEADNFKANLQSNKKILRLRLKYAEGTREDIMPRALTARLIAIRHNNIYKCLNGDRLYWRHGVALIEEAIDCQALIEENIKKGYIDIIVSGVKARDYLAIILDTYNLLHDSLGGIRPQLLIPCNCIKCIKSENPHYFNKVEDLEIRLKHGNIEIECNKPPFEKVKIRPLISDVIDSRNEKNSLDLWESNTRITNDSNSRKNNDANLIDNQPIILEKMKKTIFILIVSVLIILAFFSWAKPESELDFLGWFKVKQGAEKAIDKQIGTITVIGSVKINNRNAWSEDVKKVYVKGQTLGGQNTLSNNKFVLRDVTVKQDKIIEIAIDLKNGLSHSDMFKIPAPDKDNVSDLEEILIEVKPPSSKKTNGSNDKPIIIINNSNKISQ